MIQESVRMTKENPSLNIKNVFNPSVDQRQKQVQTTKDENERAHIATSPDRYYQSSAAVLF